MHNREVVVVCGGHGKMKQNSKDTLWEQSVDL
jgi:hypothetical protein